MRAVLLDLDGVLYVDDVAIEGAVDAVERLRAGGAALRFVTNTTARSRDHTLGKLHRLGFDVGERELITPAALAVEHCRARGHRRVALLMNDEVKRDFSALEESGTGCEAVIMGDLGEAYGFDVLDHAFREVMAGAELIALQKNRYWLRGDGLSLDVGPFVAAIEYATGCTAHVVGKPAPAFFAAILDGLPAGAGPATMVGDDIESDIGGALGAGLEAILVRTGKYRADRVQAARIAPTATVDSIADVPALLGI